MSAQKRCSWVIWLIGLLAACMVAMQTGVVAAPEDENCLSCHSDMRSHHKSHRDFITTEGTTSEISDSCKSCHGSHSTPTLEQGCESCHSSLNIGFRRRHRNRHGYGYPAYHKVDVMTDTGSDDAKTKLARNKMCLSCHSDNPTVTRGGMVKKGFIKGYEMSAHAKALARGNGVSASCVDCHDRRGIHGAFDPKSGINRANISETCGKCHEKEAREYLRSTHGEALANGSMDAPVCTTCHGEHEILKTSNPRSPVAPRNVSEQTCGSCHNSPELSEKYGIPSDSLKTFMESYHGLALQGGSANTANCASCHNAHDIRPSSDPSSSVNKKNLPRTCGKCHPGANDRFAVGKMHVAASPKKSPALWWIGLIYIVLIAGVIGGMLCHNILDFSKKWRRHINLRELHGFYVRMTGFERLQHLMMMVSFIILAITGFMLAYPDAWWVVIIRNLSSYAFVLRGILHRIAAVVMVTACVIHLIYVLFTARGRQFLIDMIPNRKDVSDVVNWFRYGFGVVKEKPKFGRFSYIEKSEYWALVWGSVIMTLTGIMMWMNDTFIDLFTKLGLDIARTIHFYEAWLAVLAIIVWHLYFVIFNPDIYPMNPSWLTGTMPEDALKEEHPLEYEKLRKKRE